MLNFYLKGRQQKKLNKGELRPEFSHLMCCCAKIGYDDIVCDPFCGFGSIPKQLFDNFKCKRYMLRMLMGKNRTIEKRTI